MFSKKVKKKIVTEIYSYLEGECIKFLYDFCSLSQVDILDHYFFVY